MDSGQLTVVMIVAIVMIASIVKAVIRGPRHPFKIADYQNNSGENDRLRNEVRELKERIKVLERITVDKENSLAKEIESLRDR